VPFLIDNFVGMLDLHPAAARHLQARFMARFQQQPESWSATARAASIRVPTLLIHDRDDDVIPFAHSEHLLAVLPHARLRATQGLGHSGMLRDAATIAEICKELEMSQAPGNAVVIREAALNDPDDARAVVDVLDSYASDPRGGSEPLAPEVRSRLIPMLREHPTTLVLLAFDGGEAVGLAIGFWGMSSFRARPLLNIHDLAVRPGFRGKGVGRALLAAAEARARARGCCKLTLEVQDDNAPARTLYERFGFRDVVYGDSGPTRFLGKKLD
jgi:ribosomal protein S18 acetylase RimI-like enzyme